MTSIEKIGRNDLEASGLKVSNSGKLKFIVLDNDMHNDNDDAKNACSKYLIFTI